VALKRALEGQRLAHGLLFIGAPGSGREKAARALACGLLCDAGALPWGCGVCRSCLRVLKGLHADVHLLLPAAEAVRRGLAEPDGSKKPSEQILVDDVRALAVALRMTASEGRARVAIIVDAHRMNPNAQNALLKTLEEPGERTTLVLLVPDETAVLTTLVSRCLRLRFAPPAETTPAEPGPLWPALTSASGHAGSAASLLEQLDLAESLGRDRAATDQALKILTDALARAVRTSTDGTEASLPWARASALLDEVQALRRAFAQNASAQMALEELLLARRRT
jgi:DNA polymerase III delta prime subunit